MRYLIPVLFLLAAASPLPAHAAVGGAADMSCVKGDCKKTDPAKEAEKEMNKASGNDIPIEAPVEGAAPVAAIPAPPSKNPVTPMQANDAIKEIEQAVAKEEVEKKISTGSGSARLSPSTQTPTCSPYAANQQQVRDEVQKNVEDHKIEQKRIADEVTDGWRKHLDDGMRIRQEIADAATEHAKEQKVQMAASADYQRQMKDEGIGIRERLADAVAQHQAAGLTLRCLPTERFTNFDTGKTTP